MFKKILASALALCVAGTMSIQALAKSSFSDVISPDYDWAAEDIEEMTTLGIIKGYTDGTFRPAVTIRKIEALLLLSRAVGYSNADYEPFANFAISRFTPLLEKYDLGTTYNLYKDEVSFLLYKGILNESELDSYMNGAGSALKRYEAAILLTKLMGEEETVKNNSSVVLSYSDTPEIPSSARPYVEYVTTAGLMKGLENNEFGPNENVTRVQMTILLRRILDALDYTTETGTVDKIGVAANNITSVDIDLGGEIKSITVDNGVTVMKDGVKSSAADISEGSEALILYSGDELAALEVLSPEEDEEEKPTTDKTENNEVQLKDEEVKGRLADLTFRTDETSFAVVSGRDYREFSVPSSSNVSVSVDGLNSKLSSLAEGYDVTVIVKRGAVTAIEAGTGTRSVSGTVVSISQAPDAYISIKNSEGETERYDVSDDATVTRNSAKADFSSLASGDMVSLVVVNSVVTGIDATSVSSSVNGTISSITISGSPKLGIEVNGKEQVFPVKDKAKITLSGKSAELYDLRIGHTVFADLESGVITSITASVAPTAYQKSGIITGINTSSSYITINVDGESERVYAAKKTSGTVSAAIINSSNGKSLSFSDLERGDTVTAIGSLDDDDRFVATTIVVIPAE